MKQEAPTPSGAKWGSSHKDNNIAYKALQLLQKESQETNCVYFYMDRLSDMLDSDNSYVRTRGLILFAHNANISVHIYVIKELKCSAFERLDLYFKNE